MIQIYAELFDGLRGYYAGYPSRRSAPGFHAAMSLSFLCGLTITGLTFLGDYFWYGSFDRSFTLLGHRYVSLGTGAAIALAHVVFGRSTGRYDSLDAPRSSRWKMYLSLYMAIAFALVLGNAYLALSMR